MATYACTDAFGDEFEITASSPREAAQQYVDAGDYENGTTIWINVHVWPQDDPDAEERHKIAVYPPEPECTDDEDHDWQSPHEVVGGLEDNPGVQGNAGGVIITEVCARCAAYRVQDTWAQDRETGEQGLESLEYRPSDDESEAWVEGHRAAATLIRLAEEHGTDAVDRGIRDHLDTMEAHVDPDDGLVWSGARWIKPGEQLAGVAAYVSEQLQVEE